MVVSVFADGYHRTLSAERTIDGEAGMKHVLTFSEPILGDRVRVQLKGQPGVNTALQLAEVAVSGRLGYMWTHEFSDNGSTSSTFSDCTSLNGANQFGRFAEATVVTGWRVSFTKGETSIRMKLLTSLPSQTFYVLFCPSKRFVATILVQML